MAFEKFLAGLSATFINLPEDQVGSTIENSLEPIADCLKLDRITLFKYSPESEELKITYSWSGEGAVEDPVAIKTSALPAWTKLLFRGETALVSDPGQLPEAAAAERNGLRKLGARSAAGVPLKAGNKFFGAILFVSTKAPVSWTPDLVEQLNLLAEIFSNALMRKQAWEAQARHAVIIESSDDAIISKNLDGIIMSWSAGAERIFEYSAAEAIGRSIRIIIPDELRAEEDEILRRLRAGQTIDHIETLRKTKSGKQVMISLTVSPVKDSDGAIVGATKIARDITANKRTQQVLRESEDRFRLVAATAPVLIWMSGTDRRNTFFNQGWLRFTGRHLVDELGDGWLASVHPEDEQHCLKTYWNAFEVRRDFQREYRLRRFDGEYRWVADYGVPRFESDGSFCGYIGSCVDITERKASTEALHTLSGRLIRAQEEERARIARELHDDFSQRLALLGIELGQLWKHLPDSDVSERARIMVMLKQTKDISSDLHTLSHQLHSTKLEHVGLGPALAGLCKEIGDKYNIAIRFIDCALPASFPREVALCLFRVGQEALANVAKHSRSTEASVRLSVEAGCVMLCISDEGSGFEAEIHNPNAGIGLIGMSERLRLVGGTLSVTSELNRGTQILAAVPLAAPEKSELVRAQTAGG
jgi:PAS domain S-box-containing protein